MPKKDPNKPSGLLEDALKAPKGAYGPRTQLNHKTLEISGASLDHETSGMLATVLRYAAHKQQGGLSKAVKFGFGPQNFIEGIDDSIRHCRSSVVWVEALEVFEVKEQKQSSHTITSYYHQRFIENKETQRVNQAKRQAAFEARQANPAHYAWMVEKGKLTGRLSKMQNVAVDKVKNSGKTELEKVAEKKDIDEDYERQINDLLRKVNFRPEPAKVDFDEDARKDEILANFAPLWVNNHKRHMSILECDSNFRNSTSPQSTVYKIDNIRNLVDEVKASLDAAEAKLWDLLEKFGEGGVTINTVRIDDEDENFKYVQIAQVGILELFLWMFMNSDAQLKDLAAAARQGPQAVSELLCSFPGHWDDLAKKARSGPNSFAGQARFLERNTDPRADVPDEIASCTPNVVCICSGALFEGPKVSPVNRVHHFHVGATLPKFKESWNVYKDMVEKQRGTYTKGDGPAWKALMNNFNTLEQEDLYKKRNTVPSVNPTALDGPQQKSLLALRNNIYTNNLTKEQQNILHDGIPADSLEDEEDQRRKITQIQGDVKRPSKPPIRAGVCNHIVQSFVATKDNTGRLALLQACLSCKVSLRQKEAMPLPAKVLEGQFLHFNTGKRIANPTSCAEVPMSKFCGMVLRDPLDEPL